MDAGTYEYSDDPNFIMLFAGYFYPVANAGINFSKYFCYFLFLRLWIEFTRARSLLMHFLTAVGIKGETDMWNNNH